MQIPWFGRKARPAQTRAPAAWLSGAIGAEPPRSFESLAREGYLRNPVVQRAVRLVSESAGGAPVAAEPAGHMALALLGQGRLGESRSGPGLVETIAANLLLHGNAYVETSLGPDGLPAALWPLRPERVTVETDAGGWPVGYLYRAGEVLARYPAMTVGDRAGLLHIRSFHPLDDHYGLGCLGAAAGAIDTHNSASRWNKALLDNAARPSGALVYETDDGATLSPEQFDRLKAEMEAGFAGAANAGRPLLLDGGLKWQPMALTPAEMDFARARDTASREIALAFGVPPMLLGLPGDNSYANYREANVALWRLTLMPLLAKVLGALGAHLNDWWPGLSFRLDIDRVPALAADRERLWAQVSAAGFLTDDEKRAMLGISA